ncbi:BMP family ABC transporter substrate-binding protein [Synergistales bacterium]|nr:BMP family ABC transporter substrate-binding protein [Synergistales bacterium]
MPPQPFLCCGGGGGYEWRPGTPLAKDKVKVGVIHISDVVNVTSGYAYAHDLGIREMQSAFGLSDAQIIRKVNVSDSNRPATEQAVRECVAEGVNIIIATSYNHMDVCEKLAAEFPGVVFVNATGYKFNDTNFTNAFGRIYQPRYLSGIVAGLRTETGKIGYVAAMGIDNSEVTGGIDAFALGVESVNPDARVYARVTHRWFDPAGEGEMAKQLIADGCDVIAQHCNTPSPQIEAQKAGKWGIGYNSDMKNDAPEAVITSVVWNWGVYYTYLVKSVIDGTFTTKPYMGDLNDGMVDLTPLDENMLPDAAPQAVAEAKAKIESGEFGVFDGVMETNDGKKTGKAGETLPDEEITGGIHWYYRNVVVIKP